MRCFRGSDDFFVSRGCATGTIISKVGLKSVGRRECQRVTETRSHMTLGTCRPIEVIHDAEQYRRIIAHWSCSTNLVVFGEIT